ncbi:GPI ethanolamine phosphate transferase 3 like protein [Argiope bruennichi]|uniref:GPI ethanolamine phosphate transferase 3 like protein n=1 Tax=Argiope bruennichi TaxID=94029 RepID=A0A8T0ECU8_ARGBR|nr:GPI ethanolamine phosphate transferase 3 like protein [Argiope bruennichi]
MSEIPTVAQVDIVPTLSLLLGLPIPFSNLGKIITPLFVLNFKETCFDEITDSAIASALAGAENAFQVQKYLHAINEISNELSDSFMIKMEKRLKDATHMWKRITNNITENRNILSSISESYKTSEIIPALLFLGIMSYKYCIKSQTVSAVCVKYGIFFVCIMTSLRWWLNIVPSNIVDRILKGNEVILTRAALLTSIILFIGVVLFPILSERPWEVPSKEIYSSSFTSVLFILLQILFLVAGDALSPAVMLMSFSLLLFVILIQLSFDGTESHLWTDTIILSLLARHWFYATAHQPTFTSIQWDAAFLLNHKEIHSYTLSGALVVINTFSSFIFHALALSSILIMRDSFYITSHSILRLHMKYLLCFGVKLLGTVIASFILRRHLMFLVIILL